jgi:hypothetical protein
MLDLLKNNKNIQKEIKLFKSIINQIENKSLQQTAQTTLDKLLSEISIVDGMHSVSSGIDIKPKKVRENVENIAKLRGVLKQIVKDSR